MNKQKNVTISIPVEDAEYCGLTPDGEVTIHAGENVLMVTPKEMTVLQVALATRSLIEVACTLIGGIRKTCGKCVERRCADSCPFVDTSSTSFAPPQAAGLTHSAVSPLPTKPEGRLCGGPGVPGKCPFWDAEPEVTLSDSAREALGIPKDAKLMLLPDVGEGLVTVADYDHDIADIPAQVLAALDYAGVCRGRLDEAVMNNEVIRHG